jgi:hypothetical protein
VYTGCAGWLVNTVNVPGLPSDLPGSTASWLVLTFEAARFDLPQSFLISQAAQSMCQTQLQSNSQAGQLLPIRVLKMGKGPRLAVNPTFVHHLVSNGHPLSSLCARDLLQHSTSSICATRSYSLPTWWTPSIAQGHMDTTTCLRAGTW